MILCAVATLLPILYGISRGELPLSIFGALGGYLLALNDHLGTLRHRMWVTTLSALILVVGFTGGFQLQHDFVAYALILGVISYWLGILGGEGAELERAVMFSLVGFITAFTTPTLTSEVSPKLIRYGVLAYTCLVIGGPMVYFIGRHQPLTGIARLRESWRKSWTTVQQKHIHAVCFTLMVLFSVWLSGKIGLEHGSWITVTVLIVLRPDRRMTIFKTLQRFLGTLAGVAVADLLMLAHPSLEVLIVLLTICAFAIPWAMLKNYGLTSFFVTMFVVILLEIAAHQVARPWQIHMATLRLEATAIGCALSLAGVALTRVMDRVLTR